MLYLEFNYFLCFIVLQVDECPKDPNLWRQLIEISPVALADKLILDLEMICDCECERPGHIVSTRQTIIHFPNGR